MLGIVIIIFFNILIREHGFKNDNVINEQFSIRNVFIEFEKENSFLRGKITEEDLAPLDKMKLAHATALLSCGSILQTSLNKPTQAIGEYLCYCNDLYTAFHDNTRSIEER